VFKYFLKKNKMFRQKEFYKKLFLSCDESDKKLILNLFKKIRKENGNICYCGHVSYCECETLSINGFITNIDMGNIDIILLESTFEQYFNTKDKNSLYKIRKEIKISMMDRKEECLNSFIDFIKKILKK